MKKKIFILSLVVGFLSILGSGRSLAYFTSSTLSVNGFRVAINHTPDQTTELGPNNSFSLMPNSLLQVSNMLGDKVDSSEEESEKADDEAIDTLNEDDSSGETLSSSDKAEEGDEQDKEGVFDQNTILEPLTLEIPNIINNKGE